MTQSTRPGPTRVLLSNSITLNVGDAAIVEGMIATLRKTFGPDTTFVTFDAKPQAAARRYPHLSFLPWPWHLFQTASPRTRAGRLMRRAQRGRAYAAAWLYGRRLAPAARPFLQPAQRELLDHYLAADVVASTGGTYLVEHYDLEPHAFDYRLCRLLRRPLVLYTQSLGPFREDATRRALAPAFNDALVLLRDERSLHHLQEIGAKTDAAQVCADAAFALADPVQLDAAAVARLPTDRPLDVVFSVRHWANFKTKTAEDGMRAYRTAVQAMVTRLIREHGAHVTFISTCQGLPEYHTDDAKTAAAFVDDLDPDVRAHVEVDRRFRGPRELLDRLRGVDLAVSTRMHFAILSLCAGVPVLPIAYEFKTAELFARLELGDWVIDIDDIDAAGAAERVSEVVTSVDNVRERTFQLVGCERQRADAAGALVAAFVSGHRHGASSARHARLAASYQLPPAAQQS